MRNSLLLVMTFLLFSAFVGNAQNYKSTAIKAEKVKTFYPNESYDPFQFSIQNTEAPFPGGNSYRDALETWKNKLDEKFPRQPEKRRKNTKMGSEPLPVVVSKRIPQQGFTVKSPISGGTPSDNTLAVSDDGFLMTSWNSRIYAHDLNSDTAMFAPGDFLPTITFNAFSPYPTSAPFDPKLLYHPDYEKFVLVFLSGRTPADSKIIVGFSSTSNPTDPWNIYELDGAPLNATTWTDYPAIAMNDNELFLTVNLLIDGQSWITGFDQTLIWQMDLQDGFTGASALSTNLITDVQFGGENLRYMCPVQNGERPSGNQMHFLSNRNYPPLADTLVYTNDSIFLVTLTGDMNINPTIDVKHLTSPIPYITPPKAKQPSGHIFETNDGRVLGATLLDNTIQFVASTRDATTGMPTIMHAFIDDVDGSSPTMRANLIDHPYLELGYPNLAFSGDVNHPQDVLIGFNHTADTVFSGYSVVYYNGNEDAYSDIVQVMRGEGYVNMHGGVATERWGDYFGIQRKYDEPGKVYTCGYWGQVNNNNSMSFDEIVTANYIFPSVAENSKKSDDIKVFPNPVANNHEINIEVEVNTSAKRNIYLTNADGRLIQQFQNDLVKQGMNRISFNTYSLSSGIYFLILEAENGEKVTEKIVIE